MDVCRLFCGFLILNCFFVGYAVPNDFFNVEQTILQNQRNTNRPGIHEFRVRRSANFTSTFGVDAGNRAFNVTQTNKVDERPSLLRSVKSRFGLLSFATSAPNVTSSSTSTSSTTNASLSATVSTSTSVSTASPPHTPELPFGLPLGPMKILLQAGPIKTRQNLRRKNLKTRRPMKTRNSNVNQTR